MVEEQNAAHGELVRRQHRIADEAGAAVGAAAMRGHADIRREVFGRAGEAGRLGDQAHIAAQRAFAEQGALGPLQHFDIVDVHDPRIGRARNRGVVEIKAGRAAGSHEILTGDAAHGHGPRLGDAGRARAIGEGDVRRLGRIVVEAGDIVGFQRDRGEGGDAFGNLGDVFVPLSGCDDHRVELGGFRRKGAAGGHVPQRGSGQKQQNIACLAMGLFGVVHKRTPPFTDWNADRGPHSGKC